MKECRRCGVEQPLTSFPKHSLYKDNLDTRCRTCITKARKLRDQLKKTAPPKPEVCECCHKPPVKHFCLDHDHITGQFRGWICDRCNTGIGKLGDSIEGLENALLYLYKHQEDMDNNV